jgi:RimJ/RimL family protein N-acetyltransferase
MIELPPILENEYVKLMPLTLENYHQLISVASEPKLVQYSPADIASEEGLKKYVERALDDQEKKDAIPFIIYDKKNKEYAGSTRYMNIDWVNKVLHIGATWIGRAFQGSGLNGQMKYLMLNHAFGPMGFEKVEFRIDQRNMRSRKAVEKLGAIQEGILRENVYLLDGYKRSTCCYGILKQEWETRVAGSR